MVQSKVKMGVPTEGGGLSRSRRESKSRFFHHIFIIEVIATGQLSLTRAQASAFVRCRREAAKANSAKKSHLEWCYSYLPSFYGFHFRRVTFVNRRLHPLTYRGSLGQAPGRMMSVMAIYQQLGDKAE